MQGIILHRVRVQAVLLGRGSTPLRMKCSANLKAKYSSRMVLGSTLSKKKKKKKGSYLPGDYNLSDETLIPDNSSSSICVLRG